MGAFTLRANHSVWNAWRWRAPPAAGTIDVGKSLGCKQFSSKMQPRRSTGPRVASYLRRTGGANNSDTPAPVIPALVWERLRGYHVPISCFRE